MFIADIVLMTGEIDAKDKAAVEQIINDFIDKIAKVKHDKIQWQDVAWTITKVEG